MHARLFLVDDHAPGEWLPFSVTRPVGELLFGVETLRARAERVFGTPCAGHVAAPHLEGFSEPNAPPCVQGDASSQGNRLFLSSRFVAESVALPALSEPTVLRSGDEDVGIWVPDGTRRDVDRGSLPRLEVPGAVLSSPWDLMARNADRILADAHRFEHTGVPSHAHVIGSHAVAAMSGVTIEPGVVLDATAGPIILERGVRIQALTRLAGPAYVGPDSTILGGFLESVSIGPRCKIRGEVESTIVLGYTNKAHDGFLGHAILGRWVNLGAGTTNSDLKNNYGEVRLEVRGETVETGLMKVGCFLGDHVRTGIGTLLNTGTLIGAGSNVFGGAMPPKYVPPFSWGSGSRFGEYELDRFLVTAERAMARRDVALTEGMRALYQRAFALTAPYRST